MLTNTSQYAPIYVNSFPVIQTASVKNSRFDVPQPTFLFALETPLRLPPMDENRVGCLWNLSQYVHIYLEYFPSYTMLKWMRKCKNSYFYHIFLFPPWGRLVIIMLNVILMKKWIGNGRTPSACAYAYTLRDNRTWRAMSATATDWWLWDENKLWTVLAYSCKRAHITELYCRGTDWRQSLVDYKQMGVRV